MEISFKRLTEIKSSEIMELMNNQSVRREMPLLAGNFTQSDCDKFLAAKESMWLEHGYGPWAFIVNGQFAGWGGLQPEDGEADLALVLHPKYWGIGKVLYRKFIKTAFDEMGLKSVTVLFPPSRTRIKGFLRLGFKRDCELMVRNKSFIKYKLERPSGYESIVKKN
jgi:[ribosomal protein S5]-alanine N-acetyltransferase